MIPLPVIMLDVRRDRPTQMPFPERDDAVEALFFDRSHESFGVRIRIGRLMRRPLKERRASFYGVADWRGQVTSSSPISQGSQSSRIRTKDAQSGRGLTLLVNREREAPQADRLVTISPY